MADWYISSVAWAAVAEWAPGQSYSIGDIVRQPNGHLNAKLCSTGITLSNNNRTATRNASNSWATVQSPSPLVASKKLYFEFTINQTTANLTNALVVGVGGLSTTNYLGQSNGVSVAWLDADPTHPHIFLNGVNQGAVTTSAANTNGTVVGVAIDTTNNLIWVTVDGTNWNPNLGGGNPGTTTGGVALSGLSYPIYPGVSGYYNGDSAIINLGAGNYTYEASSFAYTIPSGFSKFESGPGSNNFGCFRCTTAGTSGSTQPGWGLGNNNTTGDNTVTWTTITGQSTYNWSAPASRFGDLNWDGSANTFGSSDRGFVSSDHHDIGGSPYVSSGANFTSPAQVYSVNRLSGNIPPIAADITKGAIIELSGNLSWGDHITYYEGFIFKSGGSIYWNSNSTYSWYLKNCEFWLTNTGGTNKLDMGDPGKVVWNNCIVNFGAAGQCIGLNSYVGGLEWRNSPNAVQGTVPTNLFVPTAYNTIILDGVDLSFVSTNLVYMNAGVGAHVMMANCKLNASVTITGSQSTSTEGPYVELVNCDSGNDTYRCERHSNIGDLTTDTSTVLSGGSSDGTTAYSRKLISRSVCNKLLTPFKSFPMAVWNTSTGSSKTITVQIISSASLNNDDIWLEVEYLSDTGDGMSSYVESRPSLLTTGSALTSSASTWLNPPSTPVAQQISVSFTPQKAGWVRATVVLGKPSTTVWHDAAPTIV